jgi:transcriptional regulator with XRE-family HTH domain
MINPNPPKRSSNLKALLAEKQITQRTLSDRTGLTERRINDVVRGVSLPRLDNALALAVALEISLEELCIQLGLDVTGLKAH